MTFTLFQLSSTHPDFRLDLQARNTTSTNSKFPLRYEIGFRSFVLPWFDRFSGCWNLDGASLWSNPKFSIRKLYHGHRPADGRGYLHRRLSSGLFKVRSQIFGFLAEICPAMQTSVRPRRAKKTASSQGTLGHWPSSALCVGCWLDWYVSRRKSLWQHVIYA